MPALSDFDHVNNYKSADKALGKSNSRVIGNNTKLVRKRGGIAVTLHGHEIVFFDRDNRTVKLSSAGYQTTTTKDRLNRYTPNSYQIVQRDFEWYLKHGSEKRPFQDGITITV